MIILGIETSCDETAAAVVKDGKTILSNVVASSVELHAKTGGVIPENAAREQIKSIIPVINEALKQAFSNYTLQSTPYPPIDAIAVTTGPGLIGSLLVGVETAKTLSYVWNKPVVPINHLIAHIYANWLETTTDYGLQTTEKQKAVDSSRSTVVFPALALVVSGGHTDLVLMKNHNDIDWIGGTRDDAAGETFDKTARLLGIPYPGGPNLAKMAKDGNPNAYNLPRPMIREKNFDFSFSGLKTAVSNLVKKEKTINKQNLAASIQEAIADVLVNKTLKAVEKYKPKSLLLAGGVTANQRLREKFLLKIDNKVGRVNSKLKIDFFVPPPNLCTDNAAMIAAAAEFTGRQIDWRKISANPSLQITDTA